jgi:hypothetical protein
LHTERRTLPHPTLTTSRQLSRWGLFSDGNRGPA